MTCSSLIQREIGKSGRSLTFIYLSKSDPQIIYSGGLLQGPAEQQSVYVSFIYVFNFIVSTTYLTLIIMKKHWRNWMNQISRQRIEVGIEALTETSAGGTIVTNAKVTFGELTYGT